MHKIYEFGYRNYLWGIILLIFLLLAPSLVLGAGYNVPLQYTSPPYGPHGDYTATTNKCKECHAVHLAQSAFKLLRYETIFDNCQYCHDPSGGPGIAVYGVVLNPESTHTAEGTITIPGGDYSLPRTLTCSSCHSVHGNPNRMIPPTSFYYCDTTTTLTSHLLLKRPNPNTSVYSPFYGGYWCSICHNRRMSSYPNLRNHPTNEDLSYASSNLPRSNGAYRMSPVGFAPRTSPICQYCHEDLRDTENDFFITTVGYGASDNPQYKSYPHQGASPRFVVETGDDLCLNCHITTELP